MTAKKQPYKIITYPNRKTISKVYYHPNHQNKEGEEIAASLLTLIGGDVKFLPELHIPGIKNPDCEWRGTIWEIKTLYGDSKNNTEGAIRAASKQSDNIILNAYVTDRDLNRVIMDVCYWLTTDRKISNVKKVLILGRKKYSKIERSMLK